MPIEPQMDREDARHAENAKSASRVAEVQASLRPPLLSCPSVANSLLLHPWPILFFSIRGPAWPSPSVADSLLLDPWPFSRKGVSENPAGGDRVRVPARASLSDDTPTSRPGVPAGSGPGTLAAGDRARLRRAGCRPRRSS